MLYFGAITSGQQHKCGKNLKKVKFRPPAVCNGMMNVEESTFNKIIIIINNIF